MGRDKRIYRFVQDTRFGRIVLAESHDVPVIVDAVTDYVARRMIEREHAMVATPIVEPELPKKPRRRGFWMFVLGFLLGAAALFAFALYASLKNLYVNVVCLICVTRKSASMPRTVCTQRHLLPSREIENRL
jgi:hypothetical protein